MTPTVFCLVPTRKLLSDNKKLGFDEQGRFQIRDSKQETMNFSGKDDPEFVRANIKNNLAVSRWYFIRTFSACFSPPKFSCHHVLFKSTQPALSKIFSSYSYIPRIPRITPNFSLSIFNTFSFQFLD
jgi:hypothetical protein